jgi:hypothetical protein
LRMVVCSRVRAMDNPPEAVCRFLISPQAYDGWRDNEQWRLTGWT